MTDRLTRVSADVLGALSQVIACTACGAGLMMPLRVEQLGGQASGDVIVLGKGRAKLMVCTKCGHSMVFDDAFRDLTRAEAERARASGFHLELLESARAVHEINGMLED